MKTSRKLNTRGRIRLLIGGMGAIGFIVASGTVAAVTPAGAAQGSRDAVAANPSNPYNMLDCNGWSTTYKNAVPAMKMRCADPIQYKYSGTPPQCTSSGYGPPQTYGQSGRFYDNCHYVGHDEPSVKFESSVPGSGNTMTYFQQLSRDPVGTPTSDPLASPSISDYAELSPAPWFGLAICDPNSFPNQACTPLSDSNTSNGSATDAGSAFLELQFYPPGFGQWIDAPSMDQTKWTVALNIDSLECAGNGATGCGSPNPMCPEPINFALLTKDGKPTGPPAPQTADQATFFENTDTLTMNPGDTLKVSFSDIPDPTGTQGSTTDTGGLVARVNDLTTGQSGFIIASAANGFMNSNTASCSGTPFSFHAEYSTAKQGNIVDWAALEGGVLMQDEIGHFEPCTTLANNDPVSIPYSDKAFTDNTVKETCASGFESSTGTGEGPCTSTGGLLMCTGSNTEGSTYGGTACSMTTSNCENADGFCIPAGPRTISDITGTSDAQWVWPVSGCEQNQFQNGDVDYDGSPYIADWPDGTSTHPTSFRYLGPFDQNGNPYPSVQYETDGPGSENNCSSSTPSACILPPSGASFYPFWSITNSQGLDGITPSASGYCAWNFGNDIAGVTTNDFGKDAQYATPGSHFFGTNISAVKPNPTTATGCTPLTQSQVLGTPQASTYVPVTPFRVWDSRSGTCVQCSLSGALGAGASRDIPISGNPSGNGTVPANATAVVVNMTGVQPTQGTYLSAAPTGASGLGSTSNLNLPAGGIQANLVTVPLGTGGKVSVFNAAGSANAILDVQGYFVPSTAPPPASTVGTFHPIQPLRICDTRANGGTACNTSTSSDNRIGPGTTIAVNVTGVRPGEATTVPHIPSDGTALAGVFNLTASGGTAGTFLSAFPPSPSTHACGTPPVVSNVNVPSGTDLPNRVIVPIDPTNGEVCIYNSQGTINFIIDDNGWFGNGSESALGALFYPASPTRICDTRGSAPTNQCTAAGAIAAGKTLVLNGAASVSAPASPIAVVADTTAIQGGAATFLSLFPDGNKPSPLTSDLNPAAGQIIANLVIVQLGGQSVDVYNDQGSINVALDAQGWFQ